MRRRRNSLFTRVGTRTDGDTVRPAADKAASLAARCGVSGVAGSLRSGGGGALLESLETRALMDGALPTISALDRLSPATISTGQEVELLATASDGAARVQFFRDADADGVLDAGETVLGEDATPGDGFSWRGTLAWSLTGGQTLSARALNASGQGAASAAPAVSVTVNARPWVRTLDLPSGAVLRPGNAMLIRAVVESPNPLTEVRFFRDANSNGRLDTGEATLALGGSSSSGWWTLQMIGFDWMGANVFSVQATDNAGNTNVVSAPVTTLTVQDWPGLSAFGGVSAWGANAARTGERVTLTARSSGVTDLSRVVFYHDSNNSERRESNEPALAEGVASGLDWSASFDVPDAWSGGVRLRAEIWDAAGRGGRPDPEMTLNVTPAPRVTALASSASGQLVAGEQVTLTAQVQSSTTVRAVVFFRDADGNGRWTPGVDEDLGADFNGADGWSRTVSVSSAWAGEARVLADAVNAASVWTAGALRAVTVNVAAPPRVTGVTFGVPAARAGDTVTATAQVEAASPVRAVVFFRDADNNGRWTPGVDQDLGADFDGGDGWSRTFTALSGWGDAAIRADAVNTRGQWSAEGPTAGTLAVLTGPRVGGVRVGDGSGATLLVGQQVTLSAVDVLTARTVRAVGFFFDANRDGRWTPGVDTDLGADFSGGDGWSRTVTVAPSWAHAEGARFGVNAVDTDGAWGAQPGTGVSGRVNAPPIITGLATTTPTVSAGASVDLLLMARDDAGVRAVTLYVDMDNNGRWTPGVDRDLGQAAVLFGLPQSATWGRTIGATWGAGTWTILADAVDTDGVWTGNVAALTLRVT